MKIIKNELDNTISYIYLSLPQVKFNIELRGRITVLDGWSSTGKTFFKNSLRKYYNNNKEDILEKYKIEKILTFGVETVGLNIYENIKKLKNCLIIIDNADTILELDEDKKLLKFISYDNKNQYILMSRMGISLPISSNHFAELIVNNNQIVTKYLTTIEGWM